MPYEITAIRLRPQVFDALVGQEYVVQTLQAALREGRVAQTFLFSGPRGVGKTSAARIVAKALNCMNGPTDAPCGTCSACAEIARGQSLDVVEIDGASNTGVDDVRDLREQIVFPPSSGRTKIYIIDEVHMLSTSAFNALLKTIEEPPPYVAFVFATTEPHKVPATVRSRCQHFAFAAIAHDRIVQSLAAATADLGVRLDDTVQHWIARHATGSLRDAFMMLDQVAVGRDTVTMDHLRSSIGVLGFDEVAAVARMITAGDPHGTLLAFDAALHAGVSVEQFLAELVEYFRSLLFLRHGLRDDAWLSAPAAEFGADLVEALGIEQIEKAVELLLECQRNLKGALNERCELELTLSRLAAIDRFITPTEVLSELRRLQESVSTADTRGHEREVQAVTDPAGSAVEALRTAKPALAAAVARAANVERNDAVVVLEYAESERFAAQAVKGEAADVARAFGLPAEPAVVTVRIASPAATPADSPPDAAGVDIVKRIFRGEIVGGD